MDKIVKSELCFTGTKKLIFRIDLGEEKQQG